jgi:hypothetical protein
MIFQSGIKLTKFQEKPTKNRSCEDFYGESDSKIADRYDGLKREK